MLEFRTPSWMWRAVVLLTCVFADTHIPPAVAAESSLDEIHAGYVQSVTSWSRIWARCDWRRTLPEAHAEELEGIIAPFDGVVVEWAVDGRKFHYRKEGGVGPGNRPCKPDWLSCDGERVWRFEYQDSEDGHALWYVLHRSLASQTDAALQIKVTPAKWLGLYFGISEKQQSGATLLTMLDEGGNPRFIGPEQIDGHVCQRVELTYPTARPDELLPVTVWFDPEFRYLPRRISNDFNSPGRPSVYEVLSFRRISDPEMGQVSWFPEQMRIEKDLLTDHLTLLDVQVNRPLDTSLFRPRLPSNIPVFDLDNPEGVRRCLAFQAKPARDAAMAQSRQERKNPVPAMVPPVLDPHVVAAAPSRLSWAAVIIGTGLVMLLVSTIWVYRRPRTS